MSGPDKGLKGAQTGAPNADAAAPWQAKVLTLYPEMFPGPLGLSLAGRALEKRIWACETVQIRDFGDGKHRSVDDTPAGGGAGMVLRADVMAAAFDHARAGAEDLPAWVMSPRGEPLQQSMLEDAAQGPGLMIVCGRFEGIDQRFLDARPVREVSLGDFVLSGGEAAALTVLDGIVRLLPGVMGAEASLTEESFSGGLLEYPHYTRPQEFEGRAIPDVLTSGNHAEIEKWRRAEAEKLTAERRPDLWQKALSGKKP